MKALFVHDHNFFNVNNEYYSSGGLPSHAWERYMENVDLLFVVSRGSKRNEVVDGLVKSSYNNVKFDLLYQVKGGLDYYKFHNEIKDKLRSHIYEVDFVIIRVPSIIGFYAYKICKELNKPFVTEVVACAWDSTWNYGKLSVRLQAPLRYFQMKQIVRNSFATIYVTKCFLQKRYPTNAKIVESASNVQIPIPDSNLLKDRLNYSRIKSLENVFKIGMIGNLAVKSKGFDVALESLRKLKNINKCLKFHFYLVGGGDQRYIKRLITLKGLENDCIIVGRLQSGSEIFEFLKDLDLYIHPSKQEGLPRSVIEAMSVGCPVLASNVAGIPELINSEFLHKPGNYEKLFQDLIRVLSNKELRVSMSSFNFERSKEYSKDILDKKKIEFFEKVVNRLKNI
ncbi:glycosyltransferase [Belliella kenyensis]|uniref:Glycosyltransferase n=1 Tax=Belliella kenyensis TaxID=1472724 RepID=A0ABV8EFC0_9BACT|nr:glycosyltransferase [Belliella kenyensis]MCH7401713.1 glycosyltransferase family 4 protein [Belliella kenyensis]MDN3604213.1 glycosyltransferase [Belliella kenyensis]